MEKYLESSGVYPQCMQCHRPWNHKYLRETFGKACVKRITEKHKDLLFKEQLALAPHTQAYIRLQERLKENRSQYNQLSNKIVDLKQQIQTLNRTETDIRRQMRRYVMNLSDPTGGGDLSDTISSHTQTKYIRPCLMTDCKGYVSENGYKCQLCDSQYCCHCLELRIVDTEHTCKEEDVLTYTMLRKDSKNCPSCSSMIHRISGCPDMFCVVCNTAFNWNTLEIHKNGNSNPLYYKWLQDNAPTVANTDHNRADPCQQVDLHDVIHATRTLPTRFEQDCVIQALRSLEHRIRNMYEFKKPLRMQFLGDEDDFSVITLELRSRYLRNEISEKYFKTGLMRIHKAHEYNASIEELRSMLETYKNDMMRAIVFQLQSSSTNTSSFFNLKQIIQEFVRFVLYMNKSYHHLHQVYYPTTPFQQQTQEHTLRTYFLERTTNNIRPGRYVGFVDIPMILRHECVCEDYTTMVEESYAE
jgi:hypothetical protein